MKAGTIVSYSGNGTVIDQLVEAGDCIRSVFFLMAGNHSPKVVSIKWTMDGAKVEGLRAATDTEVLALVRDGYKWAKVMISGESNGKTFHLAKNKDWQIQRITGYSNIKAINDWIEAEAQNIPASASPRHIPPLFY